MNSPRRLVVALIIVVVLSMAGGIAIWATRSPGPTFSGPPEQVRLGTIPAELSALIWIAEDRGYFAENGLDVTIKMYESGHFAIRDIFAENLDIATAAEFPLVVQSFKRKDLRVLACIGRFDAIRLVARGDRGIQKRSDLKGKRIGVARGSSAGFCLAKFLLLS
ncbi:MAG: ABC transporter substrate-binding protein [Deltaproteobacteria bacterium]|nr:ABC transporter substrate-binding protein [Deltaproteobacteria bacterium]